MSAKSGIYVAKFPDGFRVAHLRAVEMLWHGSGNPNFYELKKAYGEKALYKTKEEALLAAHEEAEQVVILEYGVSFIGFFPFSIDGDIGD